MNLSINFRLLFFLLLFMLYPFTSSSQNSFFRTLGHITEGAEGRNVGQAADGGYYLSYYVYYASTFTTCLTKLKCDGTKEWEKFYNGGFVTLPVQMIPQTDNGCLLSFSVRTSTGMWQHTVIKADAQGNTLWTSRVDMRVSSLTGGMVQHANGSIYICGSDTTFPNGIMGTAICMLDANGIPVWKKHYYLPGKHHTPLGITLTSDDKIVITGITSNDSLPFSDIVVFAASLDGTLIKCRLLSTYYDDEPRAVASDKSGNIYITGRSYFLNSAWDVFLIKLNNQLNVIYSKFIDGAGQQGEFAWYIIHNPDQSLAVFGDEGGFNERNPMMLKIGEDGNLIWSKRYTISPSYTNYIFHGAACADGGFLMTGDVRPVIQSRIAPIMKTTNDGDMGCFTANFPVAIRNETLIADDRLMNSTSVSTIINTDILPQLTTNFSTTNTAFCQQFVPCGQITIDTESTCPHRCFRFYDNSLNGTSWQWTFENGVPSSHEGQNPPVVCFPVEGIHQVSLTISNAIGDVSYNQFVNATTNCPVNIPNVFTPDGDGYNDLFEVKDVTGEFSISIYNRWGLEIFKSDFPGSWWNGKLPGGTPAPEGVYFYLLFFKESGNHFRGTLQVIRK